MKQQREKKSRRAEEIGGRKGRENKVAEEIKRDMANNKMVNRLHWNKLRSLGKRETGKRKWKKGEYPQMGEAPVIREDWKD